jgi:predicted metal-dependent hydrolase
MDVITHNILYKVSYRNVKYPRLEFKTGELLFILPYGHNPNDLIKKYKSWILEKTAFIKECLRNSSDKETSNRTEEEFRRLIFALTEKYSRKLDVEPNNIYFRKMRTKWASLSSRRNLTVNTMMRYLPQHLIEYVVFHEIAHVKEKKHNNNFWGIMSSEFNNYGELEKELFVYWFRVVGRT